MEITDNSAIFQTQGRQLDWTGANLLKVAGYL